jgi:predicted nuclease with TOPRIM domain
LDVTRYFDNIPEEQITREGWQHPFARLANSGRTTTWGLKDSDKRLLGLCVMLEENMATVDEQVEALGRANGRYHEAKNKIKGLNLENGRLKAQVKRLKSQYESAVDDAASAQQG